MASLETPKGQTLLQLKVWSENFTISRNRNCKASGRKNFESTFNWGISTEKYRVAPSLRNLEYLFFGEEISEEELSDPAQGKGNERPKPALPLLIEMTNLKEEPPLGEGRRSAHTSPRLNPRNWTTLQYR